MTPKSEKSSQNPPLVVCPHGGPHSYFAADFMLHPVGLCRLGFAVLLGQFVVMINVKSYIALLSGDCLSFGLILFRCRNFPSRKRSIPFVTVDAILNNSLDIVVFIIKTKS